MAESKSRKRITVIASVQGIEQAERALIRLGYESKTNFAEAQLVARSAVTKFFCRQSIQLDTFQRVCEGLKLDWQEIVDLESDVGIGQLAKAGQPEVVEMSATATNETVGTTLAIARKITKEIARKITVRDVQGQTKAEIVLAGDLETVDHNFKATLEVLLQNYGGATIQITDIKPGSIKITIQGSPEDIERLREQIAAGELTQMNDYGIIDFSILENESPSASQNLSSRTKWERIQAIKTQPQLHRQLRNADLSDADLRGADLRGANLIGADLIGADLRETVIDASTQLDQKWRLVHEILNFQASRRNLSWANLRGANLSWADLRDANLSGANLSGADLRDANLSGTDLRGAVIDASTQLDQKWRSVYEIVNPGASRRNLNAALSAVALSAVALGAVALGGTALSAVALGGAALSLGRVALRGADQRKIALHGTDLSGANLNLVDLRLADLGEADLSKADLRGAILSEADLRGAILSEADLRLAVLNRADLRGANLRGAVLKDAMVVKTQFGHGRGLSQEEKQDLARRGAIFDDASSDRESTYSPIHR
jgi:uncharacterized protein YjbI with pentapeptide repeats